VKRVHPDDGGALASARSYNVAMPLPIVGPPHEQPGGADFLWFVYGSSLDREAFAAWGREHGYAPPDFSKAFPARLEGFRLACDVASRFWGGAVGSLVEAPGARVEGLALPVPGAARGLADHKEGAVSGLFRPISVEVTPLAGGAPRRAVAYVAAPDRRLAAEAAPSVAWLETVVRGARAAGLSAEWVAELERMRGD
jgi:catechol 2,3-dioxygenase-like lactoylglutathione lyase family enzyme